jgi:hypothetical protein
MGAQKVTVTGQKPAAHQSIVALRASGETAAEPPT